MDLQNFVATEIVNGYSWTLASRCGQILSDIQNRYGKRDESYTLVGIEFVENGGPQIWFPGDCGNIVIQLAINSLDNNEIACFQLSHECVHLLSPTGRLKANYLEEGLACYYSKIYMDKEFNLDTTSWIYEIEKYKIAYELVAKLISSNENIIKKLREIEPSFYNISFDLLRYKVDKEILTDDEIKLLVTDFY